MKKNGVSYRVLMLFCSNALLSAMGFAYRMALSKSAGSTALGLNSLVMQLYGIVVSVCISGLNVAVTGLAARLPEEKLGALLKTAALACSSLWLAAAVPVSVFSRTVSAHVLGEPGLRRTLFLMLLCILMTGMENMLKSVHLGSGRVRQCAVSELIEQGVRFLLVIMLLKRIAERTDDGTVFLIMLGMTASELVSVSFLLVSFFAGFGNKTLRRREKLLFGELAGPAFPAILTAVSSTAFSSVGSLVLPKALAAFGLSREAALSEIGVMNTVSVPITMLPMALIGAVAAVVMPEISLVVSQGRDPTRLIRRAYLAVGVFGALSLSALAFFAGDIAGALFGRSIDMGVYLLLTVKAGVIFLQVLSVAVLNGLMRQKRVLLFAVLGEAYQLALILLLSPVLGLGGACIGMTVGELLRLVLNLSDIRLALKNCGFCGKDMLKSNGRIILAR